MNYIVITVAVIFIATGALFGIAFLSEGSDIALTSVFSPMREKVRRQTFEQSQAYREGFSQELQNMKFEYVRADSDQKKAIASIVLHRTAGIDMDWLSKDLQQFISQLRMEQGERTE